MSQSSLRLKKAFYLAEAGIEDGRTTLFLANGEGPFSDDLETAAGGATSPIDFDLDGLAAIYDATSLIVETRVSGDAIVGNAKLFSLTSRRSAKRMSRPRFST